MKCERKDERKLDTIQMINQLDHAATPVTLFVIINDFYMSPDGTRVEIETEHNYLEFRNVRDMKVSPMIRTFSGDFNGDLVQVKVEYARQR